MARTRKRKPQANTLDELAELARDLDLTALADALPEMLAHAQANSPSFTDFTHSLLALEHRARAERRLHRGLKRSRLGPVDGLDGFDFSERPKLDPRVIKELMTCRFVEEKRNVLCLGRPGLGKTRIAKAIAHAACLLGYSVLFVITADMLEELYASQADASFRRTLRRYLKPDVLLLDEFGYDPFSSEATSHLFRVIGGRHQNAATILTANTGFTRWKDLFPSEAIAVASVDRLVDQATILRFTGKTRRVPREIVGAPLEDD